jgi:DNA-binding LacI/PurR family transcriptional regulator
MAATIRDVARLAGVSRGTVSRVLNNQPRVDPDTRVRVLQAIADLDFAPSTLARGLSIGKTLSVGVVVPFITRPSVVERLRGIEGALSTTSYDLVVFNVETPQRRDMVMRDLTRGERVDGMILVGLEPDDDMVAAIERSGLPTVLIDAHDPRFTRVVIDDVDGARLAVEHLLALGHRKIAFLGDLPQVAFSYPASKLRHRGVRRALRHAGLDLPARYTVIGEPGRSRARELARDLLGASDPPTAVVCASDLQAIGVREAARDLDIDVPDRVSIVGFDDLDLAEYLGLTTVRQPLFESGVEGARALLAAITAGTTAAEPIRVVLGVELIARATSGPAPV